MTKETKQTSEKNEKENSEIEKLRTIFTEEEIRSTVKAFVLALLRGKISINFPTRNALMEEAKKRNEKMDYGEATDKEIHGKVEFRNNIEIISGSESSTESELNQAMNYVFNKILTFRSALRIEGTFLEFDIEKKLDDLELRLSATNNVIEEFVKWYTESEKGFHGNLPPE